MPDSHLLIDSSGARHTALSGGYSATDEQPFVLGVLRRRWWLFGLCLLVAGAAAYYTATEFGKESAEVRGSMMYSGLPGLVGPQVYNPPTLVTYRESLFSTANMRIICDRHGLGMPPTKLAECFKVTISRGSSVMELHLTWANADDGIALLNDTMRLLIDKAAEHRKQLLREHMKHVELAQLSARNEVDDASEQLLAVRRKQHEAIQSDPTFNSDYDASLKQVAAAQGQIDSLQLEELGVQQRIKRIDDSLSEALKELQNCHVAVRLGVVRQRMAVAARNSSRWLSLKEIETQLEGLANGSPPTATTLLQWQAKLGDVGRGVLPPSETFQTLDVRRLEDHAHSLIRQREALDLDLIPIRDQMTMLRARLQQYEAQAAGVSGAGLDFSATQTDTFDEQLDAAEGRLKLLDLQLENMRQLEQCQTNEFTIMTPASHETVNSSSNKKKLFALTLVNVALLLSVPLFAIEWLAQRESPITRFATRWGLPVIADRLLHNYNPSSRRPADWRMDEAVRTVTLRIQQSLRSSGGVVLFSGIGKSATPARLVTAIAECLAHREERVLVVDATDPSSTVASLSGRVITDQAHKLPAPAGDPPSEPPRAASGLSEYFSRECEGMADLVQPTSCPGVDLIASGNKGFPAEAMASSSMSQLLENCRNTYSIILVLGPPAVARADFQMLAARADAILLAANRASIADPISRLAVQDLIQLRAPIIGVVA